MKRLLKVLTVISLICFSTANAGTNLTLDTKPKRSDKTAIIVVWDVVSLNHPDQSELFNKNYKQYQKDFTKKAFRSLKVKQVEYLIMGQTTKSAVTVKNRKSKKVFKDSIKAMDEVRHQIEFIDTTKIGKDIVSTIEHVNMLVDERYQDFDKVITVYYSNFRQSVNRAKLKKLKSIDINPKINKMLIFASSGLQYTSGVSTNQLIQSNKNIKTFFTSKLPADKAFWFSSY